MFAFKTTLLKFSDKGDKTGWTYIDIPQDILLKLKRKDKKEFRIKGFIDDLKFDRLTVFPVGDGNYICAINGEMRKQLGKKEGAMVSLKLEMDNSAPLQSQELLDCLKDDPVAQKRFESLLFSQQNYFHKHILSAKGADTRASRIIQTINAMYQKQDFGAMIRSLQKK